MNNTLTADENKGSVSPTAVSVGCLPNGDREAAIILARSLNLPFHDGTLPGFLQLIQTNTHLELYDETEGARLYVQFNTAKLHRYRGGSSGPDPFRRAIGPGPRHVVDATAGLGGDAVHLAVLGYRTTAIERNTVVSALAVDGLQRAWEKGLLTEANPVWLTGDARSLLPQLKTPPATVYLDPMFPPKRKKSAAIRKEMRLLRRLVDDDNDASELLEIARRCATERIVVKRPIDAQPLAPNPTATYQGKLVRYDVYRTNC